VNFAITGDGRERLKVQFRVTRNDGHADAVPVALGD
jgi:hypothetical protein